jgi:hypothetical protein
MTIVVMLAVVVSLVLRGMAGPNEDGENIVMHHDG